MAIRKEIVDLLEASGIKVFGLNPGGGGTYVKVTEMAEVPSVAVEIRGLEFNQDDVAAMRERVTAIVGPARIKQLVGWRHTGPGAYGVSLVILH